MTEQPFRDRDMRSSPSTVAALTARCETSLSLVFLQLHPDGSLLASAARMKMHHTLSIAAIAVGIVTSLPVALAVAQAPPTPDQMVAALKQNLAESQKRLRQYEWIETTAISLKGEEKSRKQQRVYYGADGKLTKTPMGEPPAQAAQGGGGRRGGGRLKQRIVENKKDEMAEYLEKAVALIQQYVPPNPAQIQKAKDAGNMALRQQPPDVRVEFHDYVQPSDLMTIDVDAKAALLSALSVATYLEKKEEAVTLNVRFATLADGTSYNAQTTLEAKAKNIRVVVENSGHRPARAVIEQRTPEAGTKPPASSQA
jgi:hypothetical protein